MNIIVVGDFGTVKFKRSDLLNTTIYSKRFDGIKIFAVITIPFCCNKNSVKKILWQSLANFKKEWIIKKHSIIIIPFRCITCNYLTFQQVRLLYQH